MCIHDINTAVSSNKVWRRDDTAQASPALPGASELYRPDILDTIEAKIKELDGELRTLSLDIHGKYIAISCSQFMILNYPSTPPRTRIPGIVQFSLLSLGHKR